MRNSHKKRPPEGFGERLRESVYKSGLGPYEIEKRYGINHSNLNSYMLEEMAPTVPNLAILCEVLHVSADYLLFGERALYKAQAYSMDGSGNLESMGETLTLSEIIEEVNQCNT